MKRGGFGLERRLFLRGAGGAVIALPHLASWPLGGGAFAGETAAVTRRFIALFTPHGHAPGQFQRSAGAVDFDKTPVLQPLQKSHAADLLVIHGLSMTSSGARGYEGVGSALTGTKPRQGVSLDQRIAKLLPPTPGQSMELGVGVRRSPIERVSVSFTAPNVPALPLCEPKQVFNRLASDRASGSRPPPVARRRASVLDGVAKNFASAMKSLQGEDRQRLDKHLTHLRELETRMARVAGSAPACELGDPPDITNALLDERTEEVTDLQVDLLALAMRCDLFRVASLMLGEAGSERFFPFQGWRAGSPADSWAGLAQASANKDTTAQDKMLTISRWSAAKLARLCSALKGTPEPGGSAFDGTTILWVTDCGADGSHANVPVVLASGPRSGLARGVAIDVGKRSHNDLLLTVLQTFAPEVERFGDPAHCSGPLAAARA